jgi:predicted  nucleic acid-binding Zn-ribbon protein
MLGSKELEVEEWKRKCAALEAAVAELEKIKYDYENKIAMLSSEIERQNKKNQAAKSEISNL